MKTWTSIDIKSDIYSFAIEWCAFFDTPTFDDWYSVHDAIETECSFLGFVMDDGIAFSEEYGESLYETFDTSQIWEVSDIFLLGSAIYSKFTSLMKHENEEREKFFRDNQSWFIGMLSHLASLSEKYALLFDNPPVKLRIVSNTLSYGPAPEETEEVEQSVTIMAENFVEFLAYQYGKGDYVQCREFRICIFPESVEELLLEVVEGIYDIDSLDDITDVGGWVADITMEDGTECRAHGYFSGRDNQREIHLSNLIRDVLPIENMFLFDQNETPDQINRILVEYYQRKEIKDEDDSEVVAILSYTEGLRIDRKSQTLVHLQQYGGGNRTTRAYDIQDEIDELLDSFDADCLFDFIEGNPNDVVDEQESKTYKIVIDYEIQRQRNIIGSFDKKGLPADFSVFSKKVKAVMQRYNHWELFDPDIYGKVKRRQEDFVFCSVVFEYSYKTYYYLTDDDEIKEGDFVYVPAGKSNKEVLVEVVKVEYFDAENAPYDIEKAKWILRREE